ncbi:Hypothetical protein A7982_00727 [Minicystis rosea]|nr:Hypothetical protein A7982_00727 [Minicystis rosea]
MEAASAALDFAVADDAPLAPDASLLSPEMAARLGRLSLLARRVAEARRRGRRRTRRAGGGSEMIDTRPYVLGDDPRRVAWAAYARLERLLVRLTADEAPLRLALIVDTSASMRFGVPSKLRQAVRIAAGLGAVALSGEDRFAAVGTSGTRVAVERASGGRLGMARLLAFLDGLEAGGETDVARAAASVAGAVGGRALCVILGDMLDPAGALAGARALRSRGHEVALVEVLDPIEIDPPDLTDVDLEDEETGEIVALPPGGVREAYRAALARHRAEIDEGVIELGATVLRVTTAEPFDDVVGAALRAGLLRGGDVR